MSIGPRRPSPLLSQRSVVNHIHCVTLRFRDQQKEESYKNNAESFSSIALLGCPLAIITIGLARISVLPSDIRSYIIYGNTAWVLLFLTVFALADPFPRFFPKAVVLLSKKSNQSMVGRSILAVSCIVLLGLGHITDMFTCSPPYMSKEENCTSHLIFSEDCLYPSYYLHMMVLVLIAAILPVQPLIVIKINILLVLVCIALLVNIFVVSRPLFRKDDLSYFPSDLATRIMLVMVSWGLMSLAKVMEFGSRVLFLWKSEAEEQREMASDIRRRNEALVYNILPPHVAAHFLGNKKRQHEELYSQSYSEVGVLFASMPNFSDFYSEESVNNQGLECLRFLNEVISDFDALLELQKFQDVIKIKTIGSTYMAASGLNPSTTTVKDDSITGKWSHLALLVEFAFELKKALQCINEQSFNHFVLKMGINHGPITAGVIGARKPHYDIWGNTVNVASRMESTGKAGYIQVTEETSEILRNFGYVFEQRGLVAVKGKGQLMTYYLVGKGTDIALNTVQPSVVGAELPEIAEETEPNDQAALLS